MSVAGGTGALRVLHLSDHGSPVGGVEAYLGSLLPRLREAGVEACLACGIPGDRPIPHCRHVPGVSVPRFAADPDTERQVREAVDAFRPDVVHLHAVQSIGVYRALLGRVPVLLHAHDYRAICPVSSLFFRRTRRICTRCCGPGCFPLTLLFHCMTPRPAQAAYSYRRSRFIRRNAHRFAGVVAPSRYAAGRFISAGFAEDCVDINPYFCRFEPLADPRAWPGVPRVTFIGRASPLKGIDTFVEALARLPGDVQGTMAGSFDAARVEALQRRAGALGCAERLEIRGWEGPEALRKVFLETTVLLFPSLWPETLGLAGVEALAHGIPVAGADVGGVSEWLEHRQNGLSFAPGDPAAAAVAVRLLLDRSTNRVYGENGLATIRSRFLPENHVSRLCALYERVAAKERASG